MSDPRTELIDGYKQLLKVRHDSAHRGGIFDGGDDFTKCPLCDGGFDLIRAAEREAASPAALDVERLARLLFLSQMPSKEWTWDRISQGHKDEYRSRAQFIKESLATDGKMNREAPRRGNVRGRGRNS